VPALFTSASCHPVTLIFKKFSLGMNAQSDRIETEYRESKSKSENKEI
jgi:hypothetical protein